MGLQRVVHYLVTNTTNLFNTVVGKTGGFPGCSVRKNTPANAGDAGDMGSIPGSGRSPGGGHSNPLQDSCLDYPMEEGPNELQPMASQRVRHNLATHTHGKDRILPCYP